MLWNCDVSVQRTKDDFYFCIFSIRSFGMFDRWMAIIGAYTNSICAHEMPHVERGYFNIFAYEWPDESLIRKKIWVKQNTVAYSEAFFGPEAKTAWMVISFIRYVVVFLQWPRLVGDASFNSTAVRSMVCVVWVYTNLAMNGPCEND